MKELSKALAAGALGALLVGVLMAQSQSSPMIIREDGLEFPDGTVQTTAAQTDTRRSFYQTDSKWDGASALAACEAGFHMASLWEIHDMSNLRYAQEVADARTLDDAGAGPPTGGGWVRTGNGTSTLNAAGRGNCLTWKSNASEDHGTWVGLYRSWSTEETNDWLGPWNTGAGDCDFARGVWCVEN